MTLDLTLTAPPDLSVGRVSLAHAEGEIGAWIASPNGTRHRFEGLEPGVYRATAEPLGQPSRSFLFMVREEGAEVAMPTLQAMASMEFAISNLKTVAGTLLRGAVEHAAGTLQKAAGAALQSAAGTALQTVVEQVGSEPIAVGVSRYADFELATGKPYATGDAPEITLVEGAVEVVLHRPAGALGRDSFELVLNVAKGGAPDLALRLPLFLGGVRIVCVASVLGVADLSFRVIPVDRGRRAITQALFAGSSQEARPVFETLRDDADSLLGESGWTADPWTAVAALLLRARFPDLGGEPAGLRGALPALAARFPWLPDVHVLHARERLLQAGGAELGDQARRIALNDALGHLRRGYVMGPAYFAYAAQLAEEMLSAFVSDGTVGPGAAQQLARMRRRPRAPRHAGASYTWLASEAASTGAIDPRVATVIFSGRVSHERIALDTRTLPVDTPSLSGALASVAVPLLAAFANPVRSLVIANAPVLFKVPWADLLKGVWKSAVATLPAVRSAEPGRVAALALTDESDAAAGPPALRRPVTVSDDPHSGRFGGSASSGAFRLTAQFAGGEDASLVGIMLSVCGESGFESYDEVVEFFLHPTFRPSRVRATFRGRRADVQIVSLGGFTVGAWLPDRGIELELNLATLPDAPRIVRED